MAELGGGGTTERSEMGYRYALSIETDEGDGEGGAQRMRIPLSEAVSDTINLLREIGESDCEKAAEAAYMADVLEESWPQT